MSRVVISLLSSKRDPQGTKVKLWLGYMARRGQQDMTLLEKAGSWLEGLEAGGIPPTRVAESAKEV